MFAHRSVYHLCTGSSASSAPHSDIYAFASFSSTLPHFRAVSMVNNSRARIKMSEANVLILKVELEYNKRV